MGLSQRVLFDQPFFHGELQCTLTAVEISVLLFRFIKTAKFDGCLQVKIGMNEDDKQGRREKLSLTSAMGAPCSPSFCIVMFNVFAVLGFFAAFATVS